MYIIFLLALLYFVTSVALFIYWNFEDWHSVPVHDMFSEYGIMGLLVYELMLAATIPTLILPMELIGLILKIITLFKKATKKIFKEIFNYRMPHLSDEIRKMIKE